LEKPPGGVAGPDDIAGGDMPKSGQNLTLKGAETPYRLLLEAMNEGALTLTAGGTVLYCNSRFAAMAQRPMECIIAATCQQYFSTGDFAAFQRLLTEAQPGGAKGDFTLRAGDGAGMPVEVSVRPFKLDEAGGYFVLVTDITRRKLSEHALREANEELEARVRERTFDLTVANEQLQQRNRTLKALQESSQAMTRATSETGYLNEVCKTVIANCGHAMVWIGFAEQDQARTVRPAAQAGFEEGFLETLQITWADKERGRCLTGTAIRTGKLCLCRNMQTDPALAPWRAEILKHGVSSCLALPLLSGDRAFGCITIYSQDAHAFQEEETGLLTQLADDVTYSIRSLRAVSQRRRAERRTALLAETASRLLGSDNPQRVVEELCGKVLDFLDCQVFFIFLMDDRQQRLHLSACAGIPKPDAEKTEWLDPCAALCGVPAREGCHFVAGNLQESSDPRTEWVKRHGIQACACHPLMAAGVFLGSLSFGTRARREFTEEEVSFMKAVADLVATAMERRRTQAALQLTAEEVKRSNRELEQFAYIASHDLQEPLNAVGGYMRLLQKRSAQNLDPKAREYIQGAVEGAERMERLISDLLAFSRVGGRGGPFSPAPLDAVLDAALQTLQIRIKSAQAKVTRDALPTLAVDASQMTQVFQNLIGNAIKFHGERPPEIHVGVQKEPGRWVFSVRDNGIGIEPQYFERIFQIFQRLHTRKQYSGTGVGLALCKRIVERHQGAIWVKSQPGQGSTFHFSLPETASTTQPTFITDSH
jgi:signal transduction histidine kinase